MKEKQKKPSAPESGIKPGEGEPVSADAEAEPGFTLGGIPIWLIVFFGMLFYWGQIYMDRHAGGFNAGVYEPYQSLAQIPAAGPATEEERLFAHGRRVYDVCMGCHQSHGRGAPPAFPPLAGSEWVLGNPEVPIRIVIHGLTGPIDVLGQNYNTQMLAVGAGLTDEDIAAVVTYIRNAWGNQASIVTAEQVAAVREATANRTQNWTAPELQELLEEGE